MGDDAITLGGRPIMLCAPAAASLSRRLPST